MHKSDKERVVEDLTERLKSAETLIVADYRGLTMPEIDALRGELLQHGARFQVVKNTLTRRAAEAAGQDALLALLEGPSAIAFLEADGDMVAAAKALSKVARDTKVLAIRGGVLQGKPITDADVENLAKLPPLEVLQAQLVGAIAAPMATIVGLFTAPLRDLVSVLDQRIEQLGGAEEPGDSAPAESPGEAVAEPAAAAEPTEATEPEDDTTSSQAEPAGEDTPEE